MHTAYSGCIQTNYMIVIVRLDVERRSPNTAETFLSQELGETTGGES